MNRFACRYAIVRFLPYPETGEFANVGVVLCCPATGYLSYKIQDRRYARITAFFEHLQGKTYLRATAIMKQELERVAGLIAAQPQAAPTIVRHTFDALVHPREAMIRFSEARALLADDPAAAIDRLFAQYVEYDFVQKETHERDMERRVSEILRPLPLSVPFKPGEIGNDDIHARFPLVQADDGRLIKAIKPLYLAQDEPNKIYEHGDRWVAKVQRLSRARLLPPRVLFPLHAPEEGDRKRYSAYANIRDDLTRLGAETAALQDEESIVQFATH